MDWLIIGLLIYIVGVIINAVVVVSVWADLKSDEKLMGVRAKVVTFFVLMSIVTWLYSLLYIIVSPFLKGKTHGKSDD